MLINVTGTSLVLPVYLERLLVAQIKYLMTNVLTVPFMFQPCIC